MLLRLALLLASAAIVFAANIRLYLKDGDYQMVREYKVEDDRVRYLSSDRGEWEEIPLDLVDIKKTETEAAEKAAALEKVIQEERKEDEAIRADRKLVASIPDAVGPYWIDGQSLNPLIEIEITRENSQTRRILQAIAPAPVVASKVTVTIPDKAAKFRLTTAEPEFFFRLSKEERFVIAQMDPKKDHRVVEIAEILPNEEGTFEQFKLVPVFKKQLGPSLYKVWPETPMEPGEYALVEYTEGEVNPRVWDFALDPAPGVKPSKPPTAKK